MQTFSFSLISNYPIIVQIAAGRVPGGTIVLSLERMEQSRTIPLFRKNERLECVLKSIGTISKRMKRNRTGIA